MSWDRWRERLAQKEAGQKITVPTFLSPGPEDEGFYRKPITEPELNKQGKTNGRKRIVGWEPIAYFLQDGTLVGVINNRDMTPNEIDGLWSWCVQHPIRENWYRAVSERGESWPDAEKGVVAPVCERCRGDRFVSGAYPDLPDEPCPKCNADAPSGAERVRLTAREITRDDNKPPELLPEIAHATAIDNAISAAIKKVTNETEAAQALGSKNRIAELRLAADKAGRAKYEPPFAEYKRLYGVWTPPVKRAEAKEKELNTIVLTFRESERRRIAKEQADADAKQREIDEANERAAQRAIGAAELEPPPIVETVEQPAPLAPVVATYGSRKLKEEVKQILESVTDFDAVYAFLKNEPKVKALLTELAAAKVKSGFVVPGVITREGLI